MAHETDKGAPRPARRGIHRIPTRFLGSLKGQGRLLVAAEDLGEVSYEIEVFSDQQGRRGNGSIEGPARLLRRAFAEGSARLALRDGSVLALALSAPEGTFVEFRVVGDLPPLK